MARILIVDDEKENLEALRRALSDENPEWQFFAARDEAEGIAVLQAQVASGEPIDIVLTDLVMGSEQSGMQMLISARRLDPLVMAILFTAKEKSLDRYAAFDYGAFDVVEKNIRGVTASREINIKARAALRYREWSQQINFLRRYFDPRVFETIQKDKTVLALRERTVTIVFWDIRGFSRLCESLKDHPELIAKFLTEYCETAAKTIFEHNGILDKFIGDGIMALFGVLTENSDQGKADALSAMRSALALEPKFEELVKRWGEEWSLYTPHNIDIGLGCGIHTGDVLVGNVGTDFRDQFTALGPNVNFASRIEARAESGQILISQSTEARIRSSANVLRAGDIDNIKNISGKFSLFSVMSLKA